MTTTVTTTIDYSSRESVQVAGSQLRSTSYSPSIISVARAETVCDKESGIDDNARSKDQWGKNDAYDSGPDGGSTGWLVVFGAFFGYFTSLGAEFSWGMHITCGIKHMGSLTLTVGVLQSYFEREVFNDIPDAQFQLSFAGTIIGLVLNVMGPVQQILSARYGVLPVLILGAFLMVLGLMLSSITTKIWHLYLTQGVMFGLGGGLVFTTTMSAPTQWFNRRRGFAMGVITSGAGIGGVVYPFIINECTARYGIGWTYRIIGFLCLGLNTLTCIFVKEKYPRNKKVKAAEDGETQPTVSPPTLREIFDFSILKDGTFLWWMITSIISTLGCFTPSFFLPSYATYHGMSSADGTAILAVLSASNCFGRFALGFICDRVGRLNTHIIAAFISAAAAFGIWTVAYDYNTVMAFAVVYGTFSTSFYLLVSPITATIVGIEKFPTALTVMLFSNAISIVGPNIASAIENAVDAEPYFAYKMYVGACYALGTLLLVGLKVKMTRNIFTKI